MSPDYLNVIGSGGAPSNYVDYHSYLEARAAGLFRSASIPNMAVALAIVLFYFLKCIKARRSKTGLWGTVKRILRAGFQHRDESVSFGGFTQTTYSEATEGMIRNRVLHTFDMHKNPVYAKALRAIYHTD